MAPDGNAGSVACLQNIEHPVAVARKVMEDTPHVMLVGEGALNFALANGFKKQDLMNDETRAAYKKWLEEKNISPSSILRTTIPSVWFVWTITATLQVHALLLV